MAVLTNIDKDSAVITHKVNGELHFSDVIQAFESRGSHPDYKFGMNIIWDFSEATGTTITFEELKTIYQFVTDNQELNMRYKVALIANTDLAYGIAMIYSLMSAGTEVEVEVFRDKRKAEEWVVG